ncbi:MAG: hypothetical protein J6C28_02105 [Bacilli bacterium]|nr:hypothetical protein [Bacilli bacterium]
MKENTFDIPAYKVGIVMIQNERNVPHESEDYEQAVNEERVIFVPFEDVDGLSVKDVRRWLGINEIMLYFYCRYQAKSFGRNVIGHHQGTIFKPWFYIGEEVLDERENMTIDKAIEQTMEELYPEMNDEQKSCIHCFFERYQDKTYAKTRQHIKRLQEQNN